MQLRLKLKFNAELIEKNLLWHVACGMMCWNDDAIHLSIDG